MFWVEPVARTWVQLAMPLLRFWAVPSTVVPSMKVTVPVGIALPGEVAVTAAVRVTSWPATGALGEALRAVEVVIGSMTWLRPALVDPAKTELEFAV